MSCCLDEQLRQAGRSNPECAQKLGLGWTEENAWIMRGVEGAGCLEGAGCPDLQQPP